MDEIRVPQSSPSSSSSYSSYPYPSYSGEGVGGGSRAFLLTMLILACVGAGGLLAWGFRERGERTRLSERNRRVEDAYSFVWAKRNDLAGFLTDPKTRQVRLEGRGEARGTNVTVAWQDERRSGVLVGAEVPLPGDGAAYAVWLLPADGGEAVRCESHLGGTGEFRPEPGMTCFEFRALGFGGRVLGFLVTVEKGKGGKSPGVVAYESVGEKRA